MCGARGPWPSSSCPLCRSSGSPQAQSLLPPSSCNRYTVQIKVPASCMGLYMKVQDGRKEESLTVIPSHSISHGLSYLKGTALHIVGGSSLKQAETCVSLVTNFITSPAMNLEKRVDVDCIETENSLKVKAQEKLRQRKPLLELRRPGACVEEVVVPEITKGHRRDLPAVGLHVKPKSQVRPKKSTSYKNHMSVKFPRLLSLPRESRSRFPNGGVFSKEVDEAIGELRRWRLRNGSFEEVIEKYGKKFSSRDISCMLTELQRRHDWQCTLELFQWIKKQTWHRPNSRLYTRLIGFLGREGQVDRATLLFQEMLQQKCKPDQYTLTAMLNAYGKARMFKEAIAVFNYMKECSDPECQPNTVTCNSLVDALVKGGLYDLAVKLFLDMQAGTNGLKLDCKPNVITYNVLIDALCKEGLVEVGVRVLQQMRRRDLDHQVLPNAATYNTIIDACGKGGFHERAEDLMEEMVEHGLEPDQITYTALIDSYGKAGLWESAENTFKGMRGAHVNIDVMAYTAMIDAYAKEGLHEKAESLFKQMQQSGLRPNQITYLALIDAYGKGRLPEEAQGVLMAMQAAGYEGNVLIYSSLIDAYGKAGCYKEAAGMLERMRLTGCQPNLITYAAILSSCSRCNTREDALVLLQSLQVSGNNIEDKVCRLILDPALNDKLWEDVIQMLQNIKSQAKATQYSFCNALIDVLWNCGLRGRAARVLSLARELGVYYDDICIYTKTEWCLDLHRLSVGAATTMLLTWLGELHLAWVWGEDAPETVVVVTGKGKHSKSKSSALKAPIDLQLAQLNSPFTDLEGNWGRSTASGNAVQDWLLSQGIKQQLKLIDANQPWPLIGGP